MIIPKPSSKPMRENSLIKNGGYFWCLSVILFGLLLTACGSLPSAKNTETETFKMTWEGYERSYLVHLPPKEKMNAPIPVLFNLHGGGGTARGNIGLTFGRFNELADRDGFLVVYPNAIEKNWNDGRPLDLVKAWKENIDDVGFISAIVEELKKNYTIDDDRIFTCGMSNGGFMSSRLLCDRADLFRGGAILTATLSTDYLPQCDPSSPVAVMIMNGTDDKLAPYEGGQIKVFNRKRGEIVPTDDYVDFWREKNGCSEAKSEEHIDRKDDGTSVSIQRYEQCSPQGPVVLYTIHGGGHTWPGGKQYLGERLIGKTSREINACDVIWEFFKRL